MLGPEGLESIVDNFVPTEFESQMPTDLTTLAPDDTTLNRGRRSFKDSILSRRGTELPLGHVSRVSEVLDETTDMSQDRKEELLENNQHDVSLNGLILESRKQVMSSTTAMNYGGANWRKQSLRHLNENFGDLTPEQIKQYRIEQIQRKVFHQTKSTERNLRRN